MLRRDFFKRALSSVAEQAVNKLDSKLQQRARHWIRPAFAKNELDFLLLCSRCNACIESCQYNTIFALSAKNGADVVATPALDLNHSACHLCFDWPCVTACKPQALSFTTLYLVDGNDINKTALLPKFATAVIDKNVCLPYRGPECGACSASCSIEGALNWNNERPSINADLCVGCGLCRESCLNDPNAITISKI